MKLSVAGVLCVCIVLAPALVGAAETTPLEARLISTSYWERMRAFTEVASVLPAEQPRYVPLLIRGLQAENMEFRLAAVRALSGFGENAKPAIPGIVQTLAIQHGEARIQVIHDIARLDALVVPDLILALDSPDPYVVWGSCETLAEIGAPARSAIPTLQRLVNDTRPEVRDGARAALLILSEE